MKFAKTTFACGGMNSALRQELLHLEGLPFIAGIIWAALIGLSLVAIAFFYFRNLTKKTNSKKLEGQNQKNKPKGF